MTATSRFRAYNYVQVAPKIATSGVIPAEEFPAVSEAGYRTVINLLPDDNQYALQNEEAIVSELGMRYVHIPVEIECPSVRDYERFEGVMDVACRNPVWVHCAANWRVSAFIGLYGQTHLGWSSERVEGLMASIWQPTPSWLDFMAQVLSRSNGDQ